MLTPFHPAHLNRESDNKYLHLHLHQQRQQQSITPPNQEYSKSPLLTCGLPYELRAKIYGYVLSDYGLILHCAIAPRSRGGHGCYCAENVADGNEKGGKRTRLTSVEILAALEAERECERECERSGDAYDGVNGIGATRSHGQGIEMVSRAVRRLNDTSALCSGRSKLFESTKGESMLSKLLRVSRDINRDISQVFVDLLARGELGVQAAKCVNDAIWWVFGDLELRSEGSFHDTKQRPTRGSAPASQTQTAQGSGPMVVSAQRGIPEWRIELLRILAREAIDVRAVSGTGMAVVSKRIQLLDYQRPASFRYGCRLTAAVRGKVSRSKPTTVFLVEIKLYPKQGQWIGMADLVKAVVAVEIVLKTLKAGMGNDELGPRTESMCGIHGMGDGMWVCFEAEGWKIIGRRDVVTIVV